MAVLTGLINSWFLLPRRAAAALTVSSVFGETRAGSSSSQSLVSRRVPGSAVREAGGVIFVPVLTLYAKQNRSFLHDPVSRRSLVLVACQIRSRVQRTPWWSPRGPGERFHFFSSSCHTYLLVACEGQLGPGEQVRKCDVLSVCLGSCVAREIWFGLPT